MKKKLISLREHETAIAERRKTRNNTGIACPKCEEELLYINPSQTLMSSPPKKWVHCSSPNCDYEGTITV